MRSDIMRAAYRFLGASISLGALLACLAGCARTSVAVDPPLGVAEASKQALPALAHAQGKPAVGQVPAVAQVAQDKPQPAPKAGEGGFTFPADKGGQTLGQLLKPPVVLTESLREFPAGPRIVSPPADVERPGVPLAPSQASILKPPAPKVPLLRPRTLAEDAPFTAYRSDPQVPVLRELDTGARVAVQAVNLNLPVPLSYLGLQMPDRVPVDDPTNEASLHAALAAAPPARTDAVPFTPQNLPDPFVNAQTVKLRTPPAEESSPPVSGISKPPPPVPPQPPAKK
jgi:hypothetical protein